MGALAQKKCEGKFLIYSLFNDAVGFSDYTVANTRMICD
jgi:hypothetical protein